jgi:putative transposase
VVVVREKRWHTAMMLSLIARAIEFTTYSLVIKAVDKISKLPRNSQPSDLERLYRENLALKAQLETVKREIKIKIGKRPPISVRTRAAQVFAYLLNRGNKPFIKYYLSASRPTVKTWACVGYLPDLTLGVSWLLRSSDR